MTRANVTIPRKNRHKKVLKNAKGYYGRASTCYRVAKQAQDRAGQYSYAHRRKRGNRFRALWILRINAFLRERGLKYSQFIGALNKLINSGAINEVSRKTLAESAIRAPHMFEEIINKTKLK